MKLVELLPDIQNFLADLKTKQAIRHFGMKKVGSLAALPTDAQRAAFERIRRAFAQTTPELVPGEPLKPCRPERIASTDATDSERIIALLRQAGQSSPRTIAAAINQTRISTYRRLTALVAAGKVTASGKTRSVKYSALSV